MAAPTDELPKHHIRGENCTTRPTYREGRKQKAVKVYTVNLESKYLLVQGVPAVGATHELLKLFALHGAIEEYRILDEYPTADQYTDVYLIKFKRIQSARHAKTKLDDWSFYGGVLHVCYAPDYESVDDTREKLQERRKSVAARIRQNASNQSQHKTRQGETADDSNNASISSEIVSNERLEDKGQSSSSATNQITSSKNFQPIKTNVISHSDQKTRNMESLDESNEEVIHYHRGKNNFYSHSDLERNQGIQSVSEETNLILPPPPQKGQFINLPQFSQGRKYEYARVPTAHASLPLHYDGRLITEQDTENTKHVIGQLEINQSNQNSEQMTDIKHGKTDIKHGKMLKGDNWGNSQSKKQCNIDSHLQIERVDNQTFDKEPGKNKIVIRDFKKSGVAPKFIPRQTLNLLKKKEESCSKETIKESVKTVDDDLSRELRQNALTLLPTPQGPVSASGEEPNIPVKGDNSIQDTVKSIRKRLNKFTSYHEPSAEKKKKPD